MKRRLSGVVSRNLKNRIKWRLRAVLPQPYVLRDHIPQEKKFPGSRKGGVIFTADFELAWAVRYSKRNTDPLSYASRERANVPIILDVAERFTIPVTWATVGHLFLERCRQGDHDWMARLPYMDGHWRYTSGDWFDHDPYSSLSDAPEWYAPDLLKQIMASKIKHEIACHTFSHIDCSDKNCPPKVLDDELTACEMAAKDLGVSFKSMAFPGGTAGNFTVLRDHGIKIYRRRIGKYDLAYPYRDQEGLLVSPTGPSIGMARPGWSVEDEFYFLRKAIDKAIRHNTLAHMWFHPSAGSEAFTELLPMIMEYCNLKREAGELWIGTMNDLQEHINRSGVV
jgi:peptidoglycan/xylan/chitin deacetylase (PgdA/CDA1 family)